MNDRYRAGIEMMLGLSPDRAGLISDGLAVEAPEFVRLMVEFAFADIFARAGLDRRARLFVAIAALAARGGQASQLRWFVRAALRAGCSRREVVEALMQVALFAGFAAAADALEACSDLLADQPDCGEDACPLASAAQ